MDKLWAPWRINYINQKNDEKTCLFCRVGKSKQERKNLILFRSSASFLIMNLFPYNNGHLMACPYKHTGDFSGLDDKEIIDLINTVNTAKSALDKTLKPQGYNIGINMGKVSGAGIAGHMHIHIVPRWQGDTNFMPVTAGTKIISQSLTALYGKLRSQIIKTC